MVPPRSPSPSRTERAARLGALLLLAAVPAAAQPVRLVVAAQEAGAVVSTAVTVPAAFATTDSLPFTVEADAGVRLFGAATGRVAARPEGTRLPLTLALNRAHEAGRVKLAMVRVANAAGEAWEAIVETDVRARRRLDVRLVAEPPTIAPGGRTHLVARFRNAGNAADTLTLLWETTGGWRLRGAPHRLVVAPGDETDVRVLLEAGDQARAGDARAINLTATGQSGTLRATAVVQVFEYGGIGQEQVQLPATVFAGSGTGVTGEAGLVGAVSVSGEPFRDTRVQLTARQNSAGVWSPAFTSDLAGPRLQLSIARPTWKATAGDIGLNAAGLVGSSLHGRGLLLDGTRGQTRATAFGAVTHGTALGGALWQGYAQTATTTRYGVIGGTAVGLLRGTDTFGQGASVQALGVRYALLPASAHRLRVDAGLMRLAGSGRAVVAPVVDAAYDVSGSRASVSARLRRAPSSASSGEVLPSDAFVGGTVRLSSTVGVQGWANTSRMDLPGGFTYRSRAAALGAAWMNGRTRADVTGNVRRGESGGLGEASTHRTSVTVSAGMPVGVLGLDASAELGRNTLGADARALRILRSGLRYVGARGHVSATVSHHTGETALPHLFASLNGALTLGTTELNMGAMAALQRGAGARRTLGGWLSATVPAGSRFALVAGIEADPSVARAPVRLSAGLRHRLSVPLPLKPPTAARGVVFEDANANGRQDAGEAGLPGVTVRVGALRATTDAAGRWALQNPEAAGQTAELDATTLPPDVLPMAARTASGHTMMPVIRGASLRLALYLDENGSGARDAGEPVASHVSVALRDAGGSLRFADVDAAGTARITGVVPGAYTLVLQLAGSPSVRARTLDVTVGAGEHLTLDVAAPSAARRIRFTTGR